MSREWTGTMNTPRQINGKVAALIALTLLAFISDAGADTTQRAGADPEAVSAPGLEATRGSGNPSKAESTPDVITALRAAGATVVSLGTHGGLPGWMIDPADGPAYTAYTTPAGGTVVGLMYDAAGNLLTGRQLARTGGEQPVQTAAIRTTDIEDLFKAAEGAFGFIVGSAAPPESATTPPVVHVFADPRCPYSRRHLAVLDDAATAGLLSVHVIPVAILGRASATLAAGIAGAPDPAAAWNGTGPDAETTTELATGARRIKANNAIHHAWRVRGVPFTLYRRPDHTGQDIRVTYGAVSDASRFLGQVPSAFGDRP